MGMEVLGLLAATAVAGLFGAVEIMNANNDGSESDTVSKPLEGDLRDDGDDDTA